MAASVTQVLSPANCAIKIVTWKVKKDSTVMKGSVLALYEPQEDNASKALIKLKASESGIVNEIFVEAGSISPPGSLLLNLRPQNSGGCTHPTVMKDMCADCGADLRREAGVAGERKTSVAASVAMVHNIPELIISKEQALELGKEDEQRLLRTRKLVLLVDLDQTLIHTTNDDIPPNLKLSWEERMFTISSFGKALILFGIIHAYGHTQENSWRRSPNFYELHICTFGVRLYAHTVARLIDPDEKFFSHRILSRDECFDPLSKTANLKALFPCGDSMVCIIDDREDVWNFAPNLVHVKPYRFFQGITPETDISGSSEECILQKVARSEGDVTVPEEVPLKSISSVRGEESGTEITVDTPEGGTGDSSKCEKMMEIDEIAEPKKSSEESDQKDLKSEQTSGECAVKSAEMQNQVSEDLSLSSDSDEDSGDMLASVDNRRQEESAQASGRIDEKNNESEIDINIVEDKKSDKSKDSTGIGNINNNHLTSQEVLQIPLAVDSCEPNVKKEITPTGDEKNRPVDDFTDTNKMSSSDKEHPQEKDESIEWDDNDDYLLHLEDILTRIHKAFYTMYDESLNKGSISNQAKTSIFNVASVSTISSDSSSVDTVDTPATHAETSAMPSKDATVPSASSSADSSIPLFSSSSLFPNQPLPDLKSIIPYVKRKTLRGCNIVFSGLVPLNTPLEKSQAYIVARALGANVQPDIVDAKQVGSKELATTHLVAAKPGTSKHKVALRVGKIHIVSSDWLWACSERWENCDPCLFPLSKDSANSNLISVIPEKGLKLDNKQKCLKRMSNNDEVWDEGREETVNFEQNKRQKMEDNVQRSEGWQLWHRLKQN
ncbi:hypothetical protein C0Q70_19587 [Pomacea canaliculata]|uniref:RNA polymerase II subunit A C-terminal domain phosphatase n=1 Tax=Pomacea canaliculata TaxID=400727 RepID=A0A2T7NJS2_POMCA|nr:hypothetical protein C0Q70_19587 [Pomacea canaliculata]